MALLIPPLVTAWRDAEIAAKAKRIIADDEPIPYIPADTPTIAMHHRGPMTARQVEADPEFQAHGRHAHPVPSCAYCPDESDELGDDDTLREISPADLVFGPDRVHAVPMDEPAVSTLRPQIHADDPIPADDDEAVTRLQAEIDSGKLPGLPSARSLRNRWGFNSAKAKRIIERLQEKAS